MPPRPIFDSMRKPAISRPSSSCTRQFYTRVSLGGSPCSYFRATGPRARRPARAPGAPVNRGSSVRFPQHPDEHRPQRPVLLAVKQELGRVRLIGSSVPRPQTQSGKDVSPTPSTGNDVMPEPSDRITNSPPAENTMYLPSGDHAGVYPRTCVSRVTSDPSGRIT
jgi:hypothetical protein